MSVGKNTIAVDRLTPKGNLKIAHSAISGYDSTYNITTLADNDLITKKMYFDNLPTGAIPNVVLAKITAGSAVTFFIDISLYTQFDHTATIMTFSPDSTGKLKRYYDMDVINQDTHGDGTGTFTGWNVTGHTIDGTTLSEDLYIIIKP